MMTRSRSAEKSRGLIYLLLLVTGVYVFCSIGIARRFLAKDDGPVKDFLFEEARLAENRFLTDDLCPGCRMSTRDVSNETTCWNRISHLLIANPNLTVVEAAVDIAKDHPEQCDMCNPNTCLDVDKRYWHLDRVAPRIHRAVTLYLKSVPQQWRLPVRALDNWTEYFGDPRNSRPHREYFLEYNPSIVQLPDDQRISKDAVYLVCIRVSSYYLHIFEQDRISDMIGGMQNAHIHEEYYGFATLRADLTIIDETVVQAHPTLTAQGRGTEDMRLVVIGEQLYMKVDHRVLPMWIVSPTPPPPCFSSGHGESVRVLHSDRA